MVTYGKIKKIPTAHGGETFYTTFSKTKYGTYYFVGAFPTELAAKHALWGLGNNVDISVTK